MKPANFSIVFYDGDCGFCNKSVQIILKNRKHDQFQFMTLQSDKAKALLAPFNIKISLETGYVLQNNKVYQKSTAVLVIVNELKGFYRMLKIGYFVPRFIRDWIYDIISRNRHRINEGFCVVPTKDEKKLFSN